MRLLLTAGPTCEDLDEVRFISNRSSGRMGCALAAEAARRGHEVQMVYGPAPAPPPGGVRLSPVRSAEEMLAACRRLFPAADALVAAAAVADYRPAERLPGKLRRGSGELALRLAPTPDVLAELSRMRRPGQVLAGFALECAEPARARAAAEAKLRAKHLDLIVLNGPESMEAAEAEFSVLEAGGSWSPPERMSKPALAARVVAAVERLLAAGAGRDA